MRPIRTDHTNLKLIGGPVGSDVGDLYAERGSDGWIRSVWQLNAQERQAIAKGANVALFVLAPTAFPPVALEVTTDEERADDATAARMLAEVGR